MDPDDVLASAGDVDGVISDNAGILDRSRGDLQRGDSFEVVGLELNCRYVILIVRTHWCCTS